MAKITDILKWRAEIDQAEKFRDDEFGMLTAKEKTLAGQNIDYYESGFSDNLMVANKDMLTTLNIVDAIVSIIVPSLYFRNPKTITTPLKIESEDVAPLAGKIIDYFRKRCDAELTNQRCIFDAYLFGYGVTKVGYATKFGMDIGDEEKDKERNKSFIDRGLQALGLTPKKEEEIIRPEMDLRIVAESPFIDYVSPFDFGIDPRATNINEAMFVYQKFKKTVKEIKKNKKYKNTKDIEGNLPDVVSLDFSKISESEIEAFQTRDLYEIHYRNDDKFYLLVISSKDGNEYEEHYHEESIYELGEWQFDVLTFKKHAHTLYPKSDITKIRNLQDRITTTVDAILEQVDKFVPKLAFQGSDLTPQGKAALKDGGIGALVETTKNPNEVFKELNFTQLKGDLQALIDQLISLISIQTGLTRAQLTGLSDASTATEANYEQAGQNIRLGDMSGSVRRFVNSQSRKFWKVIRQFTPIEDLQLINGIKGTDERTGLPKYNWLSINPLRTKKIQQGDYDFDIEVGSTEKVNLSLVRKSFENLFNILARTEVITLMQQQGDKVALAEILRKYIDLFPEIGVDAGKIIQKISPQTQGLIPPEPQGPGGTTSGSNFNAMEKQMSEAPASQPQTMSESGQV
jgi:hypothetical protein